MTDDNQTKDDKHQVRVTPRETEMLDSLRAQKGLTSRSEAIRYCMKKTFEIESNGIGSRRHFSRSMNRRLDEQARQIAMYGQIIFMTIIYLFALLLKMVNEGKESDLTDPKKLRLRVIEKAVNDGPEVMSMFKTVERKRTQQAEAMEKARRQKRSSSKNEGADEE